MRYPQVRSSWFVVVVLAIVIASSMLYWTGCGEKQETSSGPTVTSQQVTTLAKGNPQVEAVMSVQERHTGELMSKPGVVGTGVGADVSGRPVLLILTKQEGVGGLPTMIEGIPTRVDVVGEVHAMAGGGFKGTYRPVPAGVSVGNDNECAAGTIGCTVLKGGVHYALSNNHVFARENAASIGERIDQPGRYDGHPICSQTGQVATLSAFNTINFSGGNNTFDAAIAQYTTSDVCSMANNLYTPSSTTVAPSVGLAVKKVGRTSGLTHGTIAGINVSIDVDYGGGRIAHFVNQIYVASTFIRSGDSGSLMVTDNANANPVGLDFAGGSSSSFANPIGPVLSFFNVTVCSQ
ncbi:MAG: hypothetical protein HYR76_11205 [Ignavibacteria bacterium]|nr:hypothetical protein [Ignavibacteria bacterium]